MRKYLLILLMAGLAAGCANSPFKQAESYVADDKWLAAVLEYRRQLQERPNDVESISRLRQAELKAAEYYYHRGETLREQGDLDGAIAAFQQGLIAKSAHSKLQFAMRNALSRREADMLYADALNNLEIDRPADALKLLRKAVEEFPSHEDATRKIEQIMADEAGASEPPVLVSHDPISLRFNQTPTRRAFEHIAASFDINLLFDEEVQDAPVTLRAERVTFAQALELMLSASKTFYREIGPNTLLIAPNTPAKRARYESHVIRTFHLRTIRAKDMAEIIKGVLSPKKLVLNEEFNSLVIRDTDSVIALAERLINLNDRRAAELLLEVEILEVNRSKAEQLGLDWGSQISAVFPAYEVSGSLTSTLESGIATLPNIVFRYLKQDVDADILANPKVRVLSNRTATIHIGDRIPLRTSTILDATGQVRTTFEYRDIGIKLEVQPYVHLDNSSTVNLNLEVSTIGQNLGTPEEPAYSIGTRNAETVMMLRDGETAILGGLIRDEERNVQIRVPGLGDIPLIGALFHQNNDEDVRTDVLLTITPRVVRGWDIASSHQLAIQSGTEEHYSAQAPFAALQNPADAPLPRIRLGDTAVEERLASLRDDETQAIPTGSQTRDVTASVPPQVSFGKEIYSIESGAEQTLTILANEFTTRGNLRMQLMYNPEVVEILAVEAGENGEPAVDIDPSQGAVNIELAGVPSTAEATSVLAQVRVRGRAPGISYLLFSTSEFTANDAVINTRTAAARAKVN